MENPTQQTSKSAKNTPKKPFRINFYGFLLIVTFLVAGIVATILRMQGEVESFHKAKQDNRASIADIKAESKKIDAVWQKLSTDLLNYSSAEQECIKKERDKEFGTCLPNSIYAKLEVTSTESTLTVADSLVAQLEQAGWKQRNYTIRTLEGDQSREVFNELPVNFQNLRFYYASPENGDAKRCLSLIYSSKDAQTPGWNGYIGKCSS